MASTGNEALYHLNPAANGLAAHICLVKTAWNDGITSELEAGARRVLEQSGASAETWVVPGAVEIGFAIRHHFAVSTRQPDAYIALACVIRGDTPHFDYVCQSVTDAITQLNLQLPVPVVYGVLTVNNSQQASERLGGTHGHKGEEAALTALHMVQLIRQMQKL